MFYKIGALVSNNRRFIPFTVTAALAMVAYTIGAYFYEAMRDPQIFLNLFRTSPYLLISAIGSTLVIISGGIDLSVSGVVALTTVASAALLRDDWNPWTVMLLMLVMGMSLGAVMGVFITYLKVQPFIATLACMWFARGLCFFISDDAIPINNRIYRILGQTKILIPGMSDVVTKQGAFITPLVVLGLLFLIAAIYIAHYTRFGRTIYAMGGSEPSARLMGLPVNQTKVMVYVFNGFCSGLAGIVYSIYVMSGHGLYARTFEMDVIASVVMGGTMLTGGVGYVFGTLFGVLVTGITQTLIQFNGQLSSWWTSIVVGLLMLVFIGVQSLLVVQNTRRLAAKRLESQSKATAVSEMQPASLKGGLLGGWKGMRPRNRQVMLFGIAAVLVMLVGAFILNGAQRSSQGLTTASPQDTSLACEFKLLRQEQAEKLVKDGAVIAYERNGGPACIDELYAIYPDGRITGDDGVNQIEKQVTSEEIEQLLEGISARGWFTDEMYDTWHTPCGQCYVYFINISYQGQDKAVQAVDGGTDAPANYWQVVSFINGTIPKFSPAP
ncbi:MAG: hypothetical protein EHM70_01900 [Chloroflexota bacterium]|nr:MAG: hypothetical protein EHM70_01900 [Chloroflexota bacterium]